MPENRVNSMARPARASHWQQCGSPRTLGLQSRPIRGRSIRENASMPVNRAVGLSLGAAILLCSSTLNLAYAKPFMIVGNDEKVWWDDDGKTVLSPAGKDSVLIVDLANPESPKIVASLPLKNSI